MDPNLYVASNDAVVDIPLNPIITQWKYMENLWQHIKYSNIKIEYI